MMSKHLTPLPPRTDGIHLWHLGLGVGAGDAACLSADERQRAGRFIRPPDRHRFTHVRAALRQLLGEWLGCAPAAIRFGYGQAGKPQLEWPPAPLQFNVSHTTTDALIGISAHAPIGLDIEPIRPDIDVMAVGQTVFCPQEMRALERCPAAGQIPLFLRLWTAKEAALKMLGTGFLSAQQLCILEALAGGALRIPPALATHPSRWMRYAPVAAAPSCLAALVVGSAH